MVTSSGRRPPVQHGVAAVLAATVLGAVLLAGCAADRGADRGEPGGLVVFAAASLTDVIEELAVVFEAESGVPVLVNLAGSQTLATQLLEGAAADVLIMADRVQMDVVADAGLLAGAVETVATNRLVVAVELGNPLGITGLADLALDDVIVVLAAEEVPAGRYARDVLARAGVDVRPASLEQNVRAALAKVAQGEADAAIVYASDVVAAGDRVHGVPIPEAQNVVATYPAAVLADAASPDAAAEFLALLRSEDGQRILCNHGFGAP